MVGTRRCNRRFYFVVFVLFLSAYATWNYTDLNFRWLGIGMSETKLTSSLPPSSQQRFTDVCQMEKVKPFCNSSVFGKISVLRQYGLDGPFSRNPRDFPVLVTAADTSHYLESQGLIQALDTHIRPKVPEFKLIYYDIGLTQKERQQLVKHCDCEVRSFLFSNYPSHVRKLKNYSFKPVIVATVMQEYSAVWWVDASIRIRDDVTSGIQQLQKDGIVFFNQRSPLGAPVSRTSPHMFNYFNAPPSFYLDYKELASGCLMFKSCDVTDFVLTLWVTCALLPDCISPEGALLFCRSASNITLANVGKCHRYDQSILNILLWKLFSKTPFCYGETKWLAVARGNKVKYFPEND